MKPIGVMPKLIWQEKRQYELGMAILRRIEGWHDIPQEWVEEYNELAKELEKHHGNKLP